MSHDATQLRAKLAQLHDELAGLPNLDPQVRDHLQQTLADIEAGWDEIASESGPSDEQGQGIVHRLDEATRHFEEEHPDFAALLGSVIKTLGRMGI